MYQILQSAHSGLRWVVLVLLLAAVVFSLIKWLGDKPFSTTHRKLAMFGMISTHIQFLLGLVLWFISPKVNFSMSAMKDAASRFFLVEHTLGMLIAIVLITIGYSKAKRQLPEASSKTIFWFYAIALFIIIGSIPWPFRAELGGSWF